MNTSFGSFGHSGNNPCIAGDGVRASGSNIDVLVTEDLWVSLGAKPLAVRVYAALSLSIKDLGKSSPFRKTERGKFEAMIVPRST